MTELSHTSSKNSLGYDLTSTTIVFLSNTCNLTKYIRFIPLSKLTTNWVNLAIINTSQVTTWCEKKQIVICTPLDRKFNHTYVTRSKAFQTWMFLIVTSHRRIRDPSETWQVLSKHWTHNKTTVNNSSNWLKHRSSSTCLNLFS
jgi:hypothetical protein